MDKPRNLDSIVTKSLWREIHSHCYFLFFFGVFFVYYFGPLLLLKASFLHGDYSMQFFPWTAAYASALKAGFLPYWTDTMGCGFPLVAEGQLGPYYPLHLIFYRLLPFEWVYTWSFPFHFLVGAIGTYCYGRSMGLKKEGAVLATIVFSFSSAYGGCFYTPATLRILSWLPWALWIVSQMDRESSWVRWIGLGSSLSILFSFFWTGGYPQVALNAVIFLLCFLFFSARFVWRTLFHFVVALLISVGMALPQLMASLQLAGLSSRQGQGLDFALWGSVAPPALISLVYPEWGSFLRVSFYIGLLPLMCVLISWLTPKSRMEKIYGLMALLFTALALGRYNPLYVIIAKYFSLTMFRNPSKFLFFTAICLGFLAGFGWDKCRQALSGPFRAHLCRIVLIFSLLFLLGPPMVGLLYRQTETRWEVLGRQYAQSVQLAKNETSEKLRDYQSVVGKKLSSFREATSLKHPWYWVSSILLLLSALTLLTLFGAPASSEKVKWLALPIVFLDLVLFSHLFGSGFIGNVRNFESQQREPSQILKALSEFDQGRLVELVTAGTGELLPPNANMLYGIRSAGAYSPLLIRNYYDLTKEFGFVDASFGRAVIREDLWQSRRNLLDALGIRWILSDQALHWEQLEQSKHSVPGRYLYLNKQALPLVYSTPSAKLIVDAQERLNYLKGSEFSPWRESVLEDQGLSQELQGLSKASVNQIAHTNNRISVETDSQGPSLVVCTATRFPGWKVRVDDQIMEPITVNHVFQGVVIPAGSHRVIFYFDESWIKQWERFALFFWVVSIGGLLGWTLRAARAKQ